MSRDEAYGYEKLIYYGLKRIFYHILKDSRLNKTMKTARTVCATQCLISNINIADLVQFNGRFTEQLTRTLGS